MTMKTIYVVFWNTDMAMAFDSRKDAEAYISDALKVWPDIYSRHSFSIKIVDLWIDYRAENK